MVQQDQWQRTILGSCYDSVIALVHTTLIAQRPAGTECNSAMSPSPLIARGSTSMFTSLNAPINWVPELYCATTLRRPGCGNSSTLQIRRELGNAREFFVNDHQSLLAIGNWLEDHTDCSEVAAKFKITHSSRWPHQFDYLSTS